MGFKDQPTFSLHGRLSFPDLVERCIQAGSRSRLGKIAEPEIPWTDNRFMDCSVRRTFSLLHFLIEYLQYL